MNKWERFILTLATLTISIFVIEIIFIYLTSVEDGWKYPLLLSPILSLYLVNHTNIYK